MGIIFYRDGYNFFIGLGYNQKRYAIGRRLSEGGWARFFFAFSTAVFHGRFPRPFSALSGRLGRLFHFTKHTNEATQQAYNKPNNV